MKGGGTGRGGWRLASNPALRGRDLFCEARSRWRTDLQPRTGPTTLESSSSDLLSASPSLSLLSLPATFVCSSSCLPFARFVSLSPFSRRARGLRRALHDRPAPALHLSWGELCRRRRPRRQPHLSRSGVNHGKPRTIQLCGTRSSSPQPAVHSHLKKAGPSRSTAPRPTLPTPPCQHTPRLPLHHTHALAQSTAPSWSSSTCTTPFASPAAGPPSTPRSRSCTIRTSCSRLASRAGTTPTRTGQTRTAMTSTRTSPQALPLHCLTASSGSRFRRHLPPCPHASRSRSSSTSARSGSRFSSVSPLSAFSGWCLLVLAAEGPAARPTGSAELCSRRAGVALRCSSSGAGPCCRPGSTRSSARSTFELHRHCLPSLGFLGVYGGLSTRQVFHVVHHLLPPAPLRLPAHPLFIASTSLLFIRIAWLNPLIILHAMSSSHHFSAHDLSFGRDPGCRSSASLDLQVYLQRVLQVPARGPVPTVDLAMIFGCCSGACQSRSLARRRLASSWPLSACLNLSQVDASL